MRGQNTHPGLDPEIRGWLRRRSSRATDWPATVLADVKGSSRVSVVIPARNEARTVGQIVCMVREQLMDRLRLVDELVVVDSRSSDATADVAAAAGAHVVRQDDVLPDLPAMEGKGEALWKGLAASTGDIVVFIDGDLVGCPPEFVTGLLGPLLCDQTVAYVKGFYRRALVHRDGVDPTGGGRVTELVARPLLNLHWPRLAGFAQPLAGEYAGRRSVLEQVPFVTRYGVEIGLLIDLLNLVGLDAMAQVDLGSRQHRHQSTEALSLMAAQVMLTAHNRMAPRGLPGTRPPTTRTYTQIRAGTGREGPATEVAVTEVAVPERPPLCQVRRPADANQVGR